MNRIDQAIEDVTRKVERAEGKHTQGPWAIGFGGMDADTFATITSAFQEYPICQLEPRGYVQANARLIAAAPELLAALKIAHKAIVHPENVGYMPQVNSIIKAAIAKAEGK